MLIDDFPSGIFLLDFEFHPAGRNEGNCPAPVCLVVREWPSGVTSRYWSDELCQMTEAPFSVGEGVLCVAYLASAELDCFHALGWALPKNVLDLFVELRWLTNGLQTVGGARLLGSLAYFELAGIGAYEKGEMRELILSGGPWTASERQAILDYCESDVVALDRLLTRMWPSLDLPRALHRGRYMKAVSCMQTGGCPSMR